MLSEWNIFNALIIGLFVLIAQKTSASDRVEKVTSWQVIDDFEKEGAMGTWSIADTKNDTDPYIPNAQVTEIRKEPDGNAYMIKKPAPDGVVGNRKALTFKALPTVVDSGEIYTFYARFQIEYFPNNHVFGLSNLNGAGIRENDYNALEPSLRITDKSESNGYQNDGTLMVKVGGGYKKVINFAQGRVAKPLETGKWYESWMVVNNANLSEGGQSYDVYLKGGEFKEITPVYLNADFRMHREKPLTHIMMNCNTGPKKSPYGNGGVLYDDLYMSKGINLSVPN